MRSAPVRPARFPRARRTVAAVVAAVVIAAVLTGFVWAEKGVTLAVDGLSRGLLTSGEDVAAVLRAERVPFAEGDLVSPDLGERVTDGMTITVRHSVPVNLVLGRRTLPVRIVGETVADALVTVGLDPSESIAVTPSVDTRLSRDMTITASEVFMRVIQKARVLPFATETVADPNLAPGTRQIVTRGRNGRVLSVYRVLVTGGVSGRPALLAERVIAPAVTQVVAVGVRRVDRVRAAKPAAAPPAIGRRLVVLATGYAIGFDGVDHTTATGARAGRGIVAVDPRVIPLGTRLYVPGYGYAVAADTGGAVKGLHIDLCFQSRAQAMAWGRRAVSVVVLP